jgi:hypothetical protein
MKYIIVIILAAVVSLLILIIRLEILLWVGSILDVENAILYKAL